MSYCEVKDVMQYLDAASPSNDVTIQAFIETAERAIDRHCKQMAPGWTGRTFEITADSTRTFDAIYHENGAGIDGRSLVLDMPIAQITTVTNGDGEEVTSSEYVTLPRNEGPFDEIKLKNSSGKYWAWDDDGDYEDAISVEGRWGYSVAVPDDIAAACAYYAAWLYRERDKPDFELSSPETGTVAVKPFMPDFVRRMLANYVRVI